MVILEIDPAESLTLHLRIFHERDPVVIMNLGKMYTITLPMCIREIHLKSILKGEVEEKGNGNVCMASFQFP